MPRKQRLLTKAILKKFEKYPLYSQEKEDDPEVICKFFNPCGAGTWLATEFDGKDTFFGAVNLGHQSGWELGYFSKTELESVDVGYGLYIERDAYFSPMPLSEAKKA